MNNLAGLRVLVTGGAVRIGAAIAREFAAAGAAVAVHCNQSLDAAVELLSELRRNSPESLILKGDLTDPQFREQLIANAADQLDGLDLLVNNASVYRRCYLRDVSEEQLRVDFEINYIVPLLLMTDFARYIRRGHIINLLDQRVNTVESGVGCYGLAKKGLRDATEAAALEWAPEIRVNAVAPGFSLPPPGVKAACMEPLLVNVPMAKPSTPQEIARACCYLAQTETVTGQILFVDGGMHLTAPVRTEKTRS